MCPKPVAFAGLAAWTAALALPSPARAIDLNRAVEPPPPQYASGPTLTGRTTERVFDDPFKLQAFCNAHLGRPAYGYYQACYVPRLDVVAVPGKKAWPSAKERRLLRAHEWAHARGWRHPLDMRTASRGRR